MTKTTETATTEKKTRTRKPLDENEITYTSFVKRIRKQKKAIETLEGLGTPSAAMKETIENLKTEITSIKGACLTFISKELDKVIAE